MIKAYKLYTGADGHSHVTEGTMSEHHMTTTHSIHFEETPSRSSLDWHTAPTTQYVITLSGVLEFETRTGERFTINPGEILIAEDTTGSGHQWRLINDEPWRRAYVLYDACTDLGFKPL